MSLNPLAELSADRKVMKKKPVRPGRHANNRRKRPAFPEVRSDPLKIDSILVPLDYSPISVKALEHALPIAAEFGARISLIHVLAEQPYPSEDPFRSLTFPVERLLKDGKIKITNFAREHVPAYFLKEVFVLPGSPHRKIVETAKRRGVDLIVMTTHGYTGLKHAMLGSTAERVIRHAPCPVLALHG
jgi:universal stress protein A